MQILHARWLRACLFLVIVFTLGPSIGFPVGVKAQTADIVWSAESNISNTPGVTSTDPFLLSDPAGVVHLFWAEKVIAGGGNVPDTVMYSQWDGQTWSQAVDLFFAPASDQTIVINYPHAILDDRGQLHLIWLSQPNFPYYTINYSSAPASQARYVQAWRPRVALAENLSGTKYSIHIAYVPPDNIYVVYAHGAQGQDAREERGVSFIRSTDRGATWSQPVVIFNSPNLKWGASDTRLAVDTENGVYCSWTLWGEDGNGRAVYFARSLNGGETWDQPLILSQANQSEYERDWTNLVYLPDNQLMAVWEGGYRAYRYVMYSKDRGATWTEPWDVFPRLIGENGFAEFVVDSRNVVHLFYSQRIREGSGSPTDELISGLWHSVYQGQSRWSDPVLSGGVRAMLNPKVALLDGNKVMVAWYTSNNNDYDIRIITGLIQGAPEIPPLPWPETAALARGATAMDTPTPGQETSAPMQATLSASPVVDAAAPAAPLARSPVYGIVFGVVPVIIVLPLFFVVLWLRKRN